MNRILVFTHRLHSTSQANGSGQIIWGSFRLHVEAKALFLSDSDPLGFVQICWLVRSVFMLASRLFPSGCSHISLQFWLPIGWWWFFQRHMHVQAASLCGDDVCVLSSSIVQFGNFMRYGNRMENNGTRKKKFDSKYRMKNLVVTAVRSWASDSQI